MWSAFIDVANNIAMTFENVLLLVFSLGCLIFMAKDFKIGIMALMLSSGGLFAWFYQADLNWTPPLVIFFMSVVILALTLVFVDQTTQRGAII